ncbi:MAG: hypothetical protein EA401_12920 [Planctomycetota bacterium]|nr:MAG: hypothetical protein EA401_12920 [Planctomycetota bacterium]
MTAQRRPNVLWIFGDQHRAQALGFAGDPNVHTPHLDTMARQGLYFPQALSNCPWCTPFRGTLLTGFYAHDCVSRTPERIDPALPTVAQMLQAADYRCHYIGKWHLNGPAEPSDKHIVPANERGGFDSWLGYENNNSQYDCWLHGHHDDGSEIAQYKLPGYETDALTDCCIRRLEQEAQRQQTGDERPFFAVLSVQPPHGPYVAPAQDQARHTPGNIQLRPNVPAIGRIQERAKRDLAGYYAQIENLDANVGRIRQALADNGLADDTIVIFFSDHGDMHGSHGMDEKSSPWEESIRIPCIISGQVPYKEHRFQQVDAPLSAIDILPTTLGLCGVAVPEHLPGFDYSGYWRKETLIPLPGEPEAAYIHHRVRKKHPGSIDREWRGVVTRDGWKYVCIPHAPLCMYDLNEDPYELHNMVWVQRYLPQRQRLHGLLAQWLQDHNDDFPLPEL